MQGLQKHLASLSVSKCVCCRPDLVSALTPFLSCSYQLGRLGNIEDSDWLCHKSNLEEFIRIKHSDLNQMRPCCPWTLGGIYRTVINKLCPVSITMERFRLARKLHVGTY